MRYRTELKDSILSSEAARRFIDFIAPIYGNGYVALWMFQAIGLALDEVRDFADGLRQQALPSTATWSLPNWEAEYGISPDPSQTAEQRRANIMMRIKYVSPANPAKLAEYASAASGVPCDIIENISPNTFAVVMRAYGGDEARIRPVIDEAKPAHLIYVIYVALLREATNHIYAAAPGSWHKKYPNMEVSM